MYHSRRYSNTSSRRRRRKRHHRGFFPWPFFLIAFFIFSGSPFSIIILLMLGVVFLQIFTSKSKQYYEPPQYLGSSAPAQYESSSSDYKPAGIEAKPSKSAYRGGSAPVVRNVPVHYVDEPVKTKASPSNILYCIECGSKLHGKAAYCRFCGTRQ